jgi:hypothetical protein
MTRWPLALEAFERFLRWLSPDREAAGRKYEQMRTKLVKSFTRRGCHDPEELFDRTIDRACSKIQLGAHELYGDATAFCYAIGRFVLQEYWREVKPSPLPEDVPLSKIKDPESDERQFERLEILLNRLSQGDRDLIIAYYQGDGQERIQRRKDLAAAVGGINALRIQVFRIRAKLRRGLFDSAGEGKESSLYQFKS